jgi:iron complex transport system substrate-binding protein
MVFALGGGDDLVGRSHECDFPPSVTALPVVSKPTIQLDAASPEEIDRAVSARLEDGDTLYAIDEVLLRDLRPDVILTQNLCRVCAPSGDELTRAVRKFDKQPEVLFLTPRSIAEVEENITAVGGAIGREREAGDLVRDNRRRIAAVSAAASGAPRRRVAFLEWTDPVFCAGHWVPEMIALAGAEDPLGRAGADSVRVEWKEILALKPEVVIVSPCGYRLDDAVKLARQLPEIPGAEVYAVDANAYFARPGPRLAEGVELLGHLFHPDRVEWTRPGRPWERVR